MNDLPEVTDPQSTMDETSPGVQTGSVADGSRLPEGVAATILRNQRRIEATRRALGESVTAMGEAQLRAKAESAKPKPFNYFAKPDPRPWYRRHQRSGIPPGL